MPGRPKGPDSNEVATTRDGRDVTRGYIDPNLPLAPTDEILQYKGGSDYKLYQDLKRDDQVFACLQQRRGAVVKAEFAVEAGGKALRDKKAAESLRRQLDSLDWDDATDKMLWGVYYGFSVAECLWARDGAEVVLAQLKVRNRRRFTFDGAYRLRLKTTANPQGELLQDRKFWTFCTGSDNDDDPYGLGLAHWLYWPVWFKKNGIKFWAIFLDKYGMPTATGKYPRNATPEEKTKLLAALAAIQTDAGVILPEGMTIELVEATRSAGTDFGAFYHAMDAAIAKVIVGQTLTVDAQAQGLGSSQSKTHMDVRQDLVKADADLVCQSFNRSVAKWLTEWNFPGASVPKVWRRVEEPEDLNTVAERDKVLNEIGYKPTEAYVKETYGDGYALAAPVAQAGTPAPPNPEPKAPSSGETSLAEGQPDVPSKWPLDLAARLRKEAGPKVDALVAAVGEIVQGATSLDGLRDALLDAAPDLDPSEFSQVMESALLAANLAGRWEVTREV